MSVPLSDRDLLEDHAVRRARLLTAFVGGSRGSWTERRRSTGAVIIGLLLAVAIAFGCGVTVVVRKQLDQNALNRSNSIAVRVAASPRSGPAPLEVAFDDAGSAHPDGFAAHHMSFGDGTADVTGGGAVTSPIVHLYETPGSYTAVLTLTDTAQVARQTTVTVDVSEPPATTGGSSG